MSNGSFRIPPRVVPPPETAFATSYFTRSCECDSEGFAQFPAICNYLQETAADHAFELGFHKDNVGRPVGFTWVLTRLRVELTRYPVCRDEVTVLTFPRGMRGKLFAYRDFEISVAGDGLIGRASSEWMVFNLATRRAGRIPEEVGQIANTVRAPALGDAPFSKPEFPDGGAAVRKTFVAQRSHIDVNGHENNARYFEWMLETATEEGRRPLSFEAIFRSEVMVGEAVEAERADAGEWSYYRVSSLSGENVLARAR